MTQSEIKATLELHLKWLRCEDGGKRADLTGANLTRASLTDADLTRANLTRASLTGANLTGANLDFSAWPLWCGSLRAKIGKRLFCQLAYHICRVSIDDQDCAEARKALIPLANEFHRVKSGELPKIEEDGNVHQ